MLALRPALAVVALSSCAMQSSTYDADLVNAWNSSVPQTSPAPDPVFVGEQLFTRAWTPGDERARGDGLGPVFNAESCVACHAAPAVGGASGTTHNAVFLARRGRVEALHKDGTEPGFEVWRTRRLSAAGSLEQLLIPTPRAKPDAVHAPPAEPRGLGVRGLGMSGVGGMGVFPRTSRPTPTTVIERNTPALFGAGLIDTIPAAAIHALADAQQDDRELTGRVGFDAGGRVARFGWKGDVASLHDFVDQACANELGLSTEHRVEPASPIGTERTSAPYPDLTTTDVHALTAFVASLPRPGAAPADHPGRATFDAIGCAGCHVETVGEVEGLYSDLLLHDMGPMLADGAAFGAYGAVRTLASKDTEPTPSEFRTPPLWGVADSGPWLHDGRAESLHDAIQAHGGEAGRTNFRYRRLDAASQAELIAFLESLRAPAEPRS